MSDRIKGNEGAKDVIKEKDVSVLWLFVLAE